MKYCILMGPWSAESADSLGTVTVAASFQHNINYVLQTSLQCPSEVWAASGRLLSSLKIGAAAARGRVLKKTRTGSACQVRAQAAISHMIGVDTKGSMSKNPSLGRSVHPLWLFY